MSSFIALLVALVGILLLFHQLRVEHHRMTLAVTALGKMYCGKEEIAIKILDEIKDLSPQDFLASELSSDIYRRHNQSERIPPLAPPPAMRTPSDSASNTPAQKADIRPFDNNAAGILSEKPPARAKTAAPKRRAARQSKGILIVNPDSLSFF
jgi:hypothetical protein